MPQMYAHTLNETTRLAVWHITEPESFFSAVVTVGKTIVHPHKRLQHLCGRYLLQHLAPEFPVKNVVTEQFSKPFLPGQEFHFSISHCDDYAAAIVSTTQVVGIDVETIEARVLKIRHKFLTQAEEAILVTDCPQLADIERLTLAWSAKETLYKRLGEQGIDFKEHLIIEQINATESGGLILAKINRNTIIPILIQYHFFDQLVLTWSVN